MYSTTKYLFFAPPMFHSRPVKTQPDDEPAHFSTPFACGEWQCIDLQRVDPLPRTRQHALKPWGRYDISKPMCFPILSHR